MTETTNTPDDPDGRAAVTTGAPPRPSPVPKPHGSAPEVSGGSGGAQLPDASELPPHPLPGAPSEVPVAAVPGGGNGSVATPRTGMEQIDPVATPESGVKQIDPVATPKSGIEQVDPVATPESGIDLVAPATSDTGSEQVDSVATPEAGIKAVDPAVGGGEPGSAGPARVDRTAAASTATASRASRRLPSRPIPNVTAVGAHVTEAPPAAPGPVPCPGPAAAAPPPWRRMPGGDQPGPAFASAGAANEAPLFADPAPPSAGTAGGLLDEVPTAFVEPAAPGRPGDPPPGSRAEWSPTGERPGWSSIRRRNRPPRRAALALKRLDPWSVLKLALVLSVVLFFIWLVAVGMLYGVLDGMGVWDRLNGTYSDLVSGEGATGGSSLISAWRVFGVAAVFGAINSVLFAVALTVGAFVYNVCADLVGGIEVTLSERD